MPYKIEVLTLDHQLSRVWTRMAEYDLFRTEEDAQEYAQEHLADIYSQIEISEES